jgi:hypothetical protein
LTTARLATLGASIGAGLLFGTAVFHLSVYESVTAQASTNLRPLMAAAWVAVGISLVLSGLLAVAATPLFVVRRRALLLIAALTPVSIAVLQLTYLGFIPPTALLLLDGVVLIAAGELGRSQQERPAARQ